MTFKVNVSQTFRERADTAAFMEAWVGTVLTRSGLHVLLFPFTYNDGKDHTHTWDISVEDIPVEVKSTAYYFTDSGDYKDWSGPNTAFLSSLNAWSKKYPQAVNRSPRDWLIVSKKSCAVVWVPKGTSVQKTHDIYDPVQKKNFKAVVCDSASVRDLSDFVTCVKSQQSITERYT